jgi:hypothetical protein
MDSARVPVSMLVCASAAMSTKSRQRVFRCASLECGDDLLSEYEFGRVARDGERGGAQQSRQLDRLRVRPQRVADVDVDVKPDDGGRECSGDFGSQAGVVGVVPDGVDVDLVEVELQSVLDVDREDLEDDGSD